MIEALDRLIGSDDLIAVMTPEMSPRDSTFTRRTTTIEGATRCACSTIPL